MRDGLCQIARDKKIMKKVKRVSRMVEIEDKRTTEASTILQGHVLESRQVYGKQLDPLFRKKRFSFDVEPFVFVSACHNLWHLFESGYSLLRSNLLHDMY